MCWSHVPGSVPWLRCSRAGCDSVVGRCSVRSIAPSTGVKAPDEIDSETDSPVWNVVVVQRLTYRRSSHTSLRSEHDAIDSPAESLQRILRRGCNSVIPALSAVTTTPPLHLFGYAASPVQSLGKTLPHLLAKKMGRLLTISIMGLPTWMARYAMYLAKHPRCALARGQLI